MLMRMPMGSNLLLCCCCVCVCVCMYVCVWESVCASVCECLCVGSWIFCLFGFWVTSRCVCPWIVFVCCAMFVFVCLCVCKRERKRESVCVFEYLYGWVCICVCVACAQRLIRVPMCSHFYCTVAVCVRALARMCARVRDRAALRSAHKDRIM